METYFVKMITCLLIASLLTATAVGSSEQQIRVTSILEPPYLMLKKTDGGAADHVGNDRFEGYIADLLDRLATKAAFTYIIQLVKDEKYGALKNGRWNGMIGEVMNSEADMAAAPLTMSEQRRAVVDFTVPFMTFGSAILMKKPHTDVNGTTQSPPLPTISSISDLAYQKDIMYGVIKDGRTASFFSRSTDPAYKQMWQEMSNNPDYGTVPDTKEGVRKVRQLDGRYAFITEGPTATFWTHRQPCDLVRVEGQLDTRNFALAVRPGSEWKEKIDAALTQMKEDKELERLYHKWWIARSECNGATSVISSGSVVIALLTVLVAVASY